MKLPSNRWYCRCFVQWSLNELHAWNMILLLKKQVIFRKALLFPSRLFQRIPFLTGENALEVGFFCFNDGVELCNSSIFSTWKFDGCKLEDDPASFWASGLFSEAFAVSCWLEIPPPHGGFSFQKIHPRMPETFRFRNYSECLLENVDD